MERNEPTAGARRFGAYLKRIREHRKLSLDSVEEMSSGHVERVTKSHLSRIENGRAVPTFPRLIALGQIYGVPISRLAERFELEIVRDTAPAEAADLPLDRLAEDVRGLRQAGRYTEALSILTVALDRETATRADDDSALVQLKLQIISCLTHLGRLETAKQEAEDLLSSDTLTKEQRLLALQFFVSACFRLGRLTIAELALKQASAEASDLPSPSRLRADLATLRGNMSMATGDAAAAANAYAEALASYETLAVSFEACRVKTLLAGARIETGELEQAEKALLEAARESETSGFHRQHALALSLLATVAYRRGDLRAAEPLALRSNSVSRERDYPTLVFRNCFYLWKMARATGDGVAERMNLRSLKSFLGRVEEAIPEAEEFRRFLERGES